MQLIPGPSLFHCPVKKAGNGPGYEASMEEVMFNELVLTGFMWQQKVKLSICSWLTSDIKNFNGDNMFS